MRHESQLSVASHEEEDDQRIGKRYQECRQAVMEERAFLLSADMDILRRVAPVGMYSEYHQDNAARQLKPEAHAVLLYEVNDERDTGTCYYRIDKIGYAGTYTRYETIPSTLVQSTLYA